MPRPYDNGAAHIAFRVTEIDAAVAYLRDKEGVVLYGKPVHFSDGPISGMRFIQFETPWGMVMELDEWPDEMPYQDSTSGRWTPFHDGWDE